MSEVFIRFFVETVGHYSLFLTQSEKGERAFQREAFRKSVASKSIRRFLEVFMESQMFAGFIQDRELRKCRAKGKARRAWGGGFWGDVRSPPTFLLPTGLSSQALVSFHQEALELLARAGLLTSLFF